MRKRLSPHPASLKHIPQRTCVACRKVKAKREVVRLVRTADGSVQIDTTGKKSGRGAYLCQASECWDTGLNGNQLEHALRTTLTRENREQLIQYRKRLEANAQSSQAG